MNDLHELFQSFSDNSLKVKFKMNDGGYIILSNEGNVYKGEDAIALSKKWDKEIYSIEWKYKYLLFFNYEREIL